MATERQIGTRVQLKTDTSANWKTASDNSQFKPKKGEPIIYQDSGKAPKIKIGDGSTLVDSLPFLGEQTQQASGIVATESSSGNIVIANLAATTAIAEDTEF